MMLTLGFHSSRQRLPELVVSHPLIHSEGGEALIVFLFLVLGLK